MCEPITMTALGVLGVGAAVGGGVMSTISTQNQMEAQAAQYEYQAKVADLNRKNLEDQAYAEQEQGSWEKRNLALKQAHELGKARASFGASGGALGSGSLLLYEEDAAQTNELDLKQMQYGIDQRVWQHRTNAWNAATERDALFASADNTRGQMGLAMGAGIANTVSAGLSATTSAIGMYNGVKDWNFDLFGSSSKGNLAVNPSGMRNTKNLA